MVRQSKLGRSLDADRERTAVSLQRNVSLGNDDLCLGVRRKRQQTRCYGSGSHCVGPQSFLKGFGLGAMCLRVPHLPLLVSPLLRGDSITARELLKVAKYRATPPL